MTRRQRAQIFHGKPKRRPFGTPFWLVAEEGFEPTTFGL